MSQSRPDGTLDAAVLASCGWEQAPRELGEEELLGQLLVLNLERAGQQAL